MAVVAASPVGLGSRSCAAAVDRTVVTPVPVSGASDATSSSLRSALRYRVGATRAVCSPPWSIVLASPARFRFSPFPRAIGAGGRQEETGASHRVLSPTALAGGVASFRGGQPPEPSRFGIRPRGEPVFQQSAAIALSLRFFAEPRGLFRTGVHPPISRAFCGPRRGSCIVAYLFCAMFRYPLHGISRSPGRDFAFPAALMGFGPSQF